MTATTPQTRARRTPHRSPPVTAAVAPPAPATTAAAAVCPVAFSMTIPAALVGMATAALAAAAAAVEARRRRRDEALRAELHQRGAGNGHGRFVTAATGRRRLHVVYSGPPEVALEGNGQQQQQQRHHHQAAPCVVLEAGANSWSPVWARVASLLEARGLRVLSYDRAGFGRSDADPAPARGVAAAGADLVAAVRRAGAGPPYVLVAHSLGAVFVHAALRALPREDILGVVYVDAASRATLREIAGLVPRAIPPPWLARLLGALGVLRAAAPRLLRVYYDAFAAEPRLRAEALATWARGDWLLAYTREWRAALQYAGTPTMFSQRLNGKKRYRLHKNPLPALVSTTVAVLANCRNCRRGVNMEASRGQKCVPLLAARHSLPLSGRARAGIPVDEADEPYLTDGLESRTGLFDAEEMPGWLGQTPIAVIVPDIYDRTAGAKEIGELQRRVAQYSSDVELFAPTNCGHFVQLERPDVVADAVCGVVRRAQATRAMKAEPQDGDVP